jgi:hypothetical protein
LFLEHVYNFFLNQNVLSEGSSILNAVGESSSQGSSQQNISGVGSSSNNPHPGPNPNPGPAVSYMDTVLARDTDRLASYLESYRNEFYQKAGVLFSDYRSNNQPIGYYNREISRIARFVRTLHPE